MFYRANSQTQGTGLGLYIVKKSAETLNGTIEMQSEENKGTIFYLHLPTQRTVSS